MESRGKVSPSSEERPGELRDRDLPGSDPINTIAAEMVAVVRDNIVPLEFPVLGRV